MSGVTLNLRVDAYTNRVLGVIKEAFGLRSKSEALQKFVQLRGDEFLREQVSDQVLQELKAIDEAHTKKYGFRKMTKRQLDELFTPK